MRRWAEAKRFIPIIGQIARLRCAPLEMTRGGVSGSLPETCRDSGRGFLSNNGMLSRSEHSSYFRRLANSLKALNS